MAHDLLPSQRNDIFLALRQAGFAPEEFSWKKDVTRHGNVATHVPVLEHDSSRYYFQFDLLKGAHWCEYSPGDDKLVQTAYPGTWVTLLPYFSDWLTFLRREVQAPDLWSGVAGAGRLFGAPDEGDDNEPFSADEKNRIRGSIDEVRKYFRATHGHSERVAFVEERLDYLIESSERLGRKDWHAIALGVMTNIVVGAALAPDAARDLIRVAGAALSWLFGGPPLLPTPLN